MALIQPVSWSQSSILKRMKDILLAISQGTTTSETVTSDTDATAVRNVRDYEILERLDQVINQMERLNTHLSYLTESQLDIGDSGAD